MPRGKQVQQRIVVHSLAQWDNIAADFAEIDQRMYDELRPRLLINKPHFRTPRVYVPSLMPSNCTPSTSAANDDLPARQRMAIDRDPTGLLAQVLIYH